MVKVENLNFSYNTKEENLFDINLEIKQGECILICGRSGSGKSSITKLFNSLIPNYYEGKLEGKVYVKGMDTTEKEIYEISRVISSVFQDPKTQFFNINTSSEILFYLENRGFPRDVMVKRLEEAAKIFNIEHLLNRNIFELSGGEKQIIAIASAYVSGTDIIVLDEPSSNLDYLSSEIVGEMLKQLKKEGKTLIVAEHRFYFIKDLIDRVYYLDSGKVKKVFSKEKFFSLDINERKNLGLRNVFFEKLNTKSKKEPNKEGLEIHKLAYKFKDGNGKLDVENLFFPLGSIVGVVGKNGSGKSSFIRSLMGLEKRDSTEISFRGKRLTKKDRIKKSYMVMQDVNYQLFTESVTNETILGKSGKFSESDVDEILKSLNIYDLKEKHPMALSGGQKQRVAVASALVSGAEIICFDEPTSGMDYENMLRISKLIKSCSNENNIIFIISHDNEFLNETVDEIFDISKYSTKEKQEFVMKKLLTYAKDKKVHFYISIFYMLLSTLAWIGSFLTAYYFIDGFLFSTITQNKILNLSAVLLSLLFFYALFKSLGLKHSHVFAYNALAEVRKDFIEKMVKNPLGTTLKQTAGSYRQKIVDSVEQVEILLAHGFPEGIPYIMGSIAIFITIFIVDYRLGLLALVPIFISIFLMGLLMKNSIKKMVKYYEASKEMSANIIEFVEGIEVIKIFNRKISSYEKLSNSVKGYRDYTLNWFRESWTYMAIVNSLAPTISFLILPVGILMINQGTLALNKLIFVNLLCFAGAVPVTKLLFFFPVIAQITKKMEDLEKDFREKELITGDKILEGENIDIEFNNVDFSYKDKPVIFDATFKINAGEKVAFVGESGSGKSTLAKLIMHYYDVDNGEIRIGSHPITEINLSSLMDKISYVSQDNFLFDISIRDNILIGKPDATEEEVIGAAKAANIHDFIVNLENGYDTRVGDGGDRLSGGEKQRICIARAMIKDSPIIILDEATSYTDPENEYFITEAIENLCKNKTVIIIAHKLSKIKKADKIILINEGKIVETGKHEELLENDIYNNLWNRYVSAKSFEFNIKEG